LIGRSPSQAVQRYIEPLTDALQCVTQRRLSRPPTRELKLDTLYEANLGDMDPVVLAGPTPLMFSAGQNFEIVEIDRDDPRGRFAIRPRGYFYEIATADDRQILSFHWQPDAKPSRSSDRVVTLPHIHVGTAISAGQAAVGRDFHKVHIPTGVVPLSDVVWLLIDQFSVTLQHHRWQDVLTRTGALFGE
jgi:hypothetical protein